MKPYIHSKCSVRRYGGTVEDYLPIHDFMDSTKCAYANLKHRAILHNTFGIYLAERVFGVTITNSDGKKISVRDIAEDHVVEDIGFIPTLEKWLEGMPTEEWMAPTKQRQNIKKTRIAVEEELLD